MTDTKGDNLTGFQGRNEPYLCAVDGKRCNEVFMS